MTNASQIAQAYPKAEGMADKIVSISSALNIDPSWLANVIRSESNFNPQAVNPDSYATGLIQFMPFTAKRLLDSSSNSSAQQAVYNMDADQQLDLAYEYLLPYKGRMKSQLDVILAVFYPYAIGKGDDFDIADHYAYKNGKYPRDSAKYIERRDYLIRINGGIRYAIDYYNKFLKNWSLTPAKAAGFAIGSFVFLGLFGVGMWYLLREKK